MNLDDELRSALQRKAPPPGFAERVLAAARRQDRDRRPLWRPIAAAVLLAAILGAGTARWIERRREGQRARAEVLLALRITSHKLHEAKAHVHEIATR